MAGGADLTTALDVKIEPSRCLGCGDGGDAAVINRFLKSAFAGTAFEPGAAPACHRQMRHVGIDIDTGHQPAAKAEATRNLIVMDLIFRCLGGVIGFDAIGAESSSAHGRNSPIGHSGLHRRRCSAILSFEPTLSTKPRPRAMDSH